MTASGVKAAGISSPAIAPEVSGSSPVKKPVHASPGEQPQQQQPHPPAKPPSTPTSNTPRQPPPQQQQQQHGNPSSSSHQAPSRVLPVSKPVASGDGEAGDVIGDYVLGETIGKGTFGKVKIGLHPVTGEKVAVKILEKKRIVQVADVERVAREIKILKRNRHLNVIQLYEAIDSPERICLIMEHVDSGEVFEYIVAHHRIREQDAVVFFQQIVDGLSYLHTNEVTHHDLKPENLLLQSHSAGFLVKIVDFGLSNMHDGGRLLRTVLLLQLLAQTRLRVLLNLFVELLLHLHRPFARRTSGSTATTTARQRFSTNPWIVGTHERIHFREVHLASSSQLVDRVLKVDDQEPECMPDSFRERVLVQLLHLSARIVAQVRFGAVIAIVKRSSLRALVVNGFFLVLLLFLLRDGLEVRVVQDREEDVEQDQQQQQVERDVEHRPEHVMRVTQLLVVEIPRHRLQQCQDCDPKRAKLADAQPEEQVSDLRKAADAHDEIDEEPEEIHRSATQHAQQQTHALGHLRVLQQLEPHERSVHRAQHALSVAQARERLELWNLTQRRAVDSARAFATQCPVLLVDHVQTEANRCSKHQQKE